MPTIYSIGSHSEAVNSIDSRMKERNNGNTSNPDKYRNLAKQLIRFSSGSFVREIMNYFQHSEESLKAFRKVVDAFREFVGEVRKASPATAIDYWDDFQESFEHYALEQCATCEVITQRPELNHDGFCYKCVTRQLEEAMNDRQNFLNSRS